MQKRIDQIISELLALKSKIEPQINQPTESQNEHPTEQQIEHPIRRRTNRSFPLNKSKFLNVEQRDQVLQFASNNKETIMNQSRANRIQFLQNLVREQLNIDLSLYMTNKLIQLISSNN